MVTVSELSKSFGDKVLYENVELRLKAGTRYGLIGGNGSGKTTFLRILTGEEQATTGAVEFDPGRTVGYLRQDHHTFDTFSLLETVYQGHSRLWELMRERDALYALRELSEDEGVRVAEIEMEFADLDGYTAEARAGELLEGLGIATQRHGEALANLTGGWKLRVLLAQCLFARPDILLLDEPTNHLDIHTIRWLERMLVQHEGLLVVISHDRHFIDNVCTHILDVDYREITAFTGNYSAWERAIAQARERAEAQNERMYKRKEELQDFVRRFSANASKSSQASSRQKQLEKLDFVEIRPSSRVAPRPVLKVEQECGRQVVSVRGVSKAYDAPVLHNLDIEVQNGEKVAIIGTNGAGKSTLVRILMGVTPPDGGEVVWGSAATRSYFPQDPFELLDPERTALEWLYGFRPTWSLQDIRALLGRMLFSGASVEKKTAVLSGGEKARLLFAMLMAQQSNTIVLDEPTNHLDLEAIGAFTESLRDYNGTLLFVSHDRSFVSSLATRVIEIVDGTILDYPGGFEDYLTGPREEMLTRRRLRA